MGKKHTLWHWEWGRISAPKSGDREPWFDTINLEWSIVYIEGSQVMHSKKILKIVSAIANSVDPDEMLHYAAFHLGLHCLAVFAKVCILESLEIKGYI